jgi:3-oxoacyl-[acyl-carrier protein] reductase
MGAEKEESNMNAIAYPDLKGKTVLVTGASKALGAETAREFARSGARVAVNGRDEQALSRVASSISSEGGECIAIAADVTSAAELIRLQASIQGRFGDVSVLAAFAGGLGNPVSVLDMRE